MADPQEIISLREFARRAGVSEATVRNHVKCGRLKVSKRETLGIDAGQLETYSKKV